MLDTITVHQVYAMKVGSEFGKRDDTDSAAIATPFAYRVDAIKKRQTHGGPRVYYSVIGEKPRTGKRVITEGSMLLSSFRRLAARVLDENEASAVAGGASVEVTR